MTENKQQEKQDSGFPQKKITDEKLEEEIKNGKSYKEIAEKYGYGYPSRALIRRIRDLGFRKANKVSVNEYGSATFSVPGKELEKAVSHHNSFGLDDDVFYSVRATEDGDLVVELSENPLVEKEVDE